ncbi:MAG: SUMF1/EgtB/PvdO family nonheme iron enzyme [Planctomycetes bacterium]|nr:SUMF1/EgtB/PvdO family nonheme iron enzyme [Planctomycetota bacterium]
MLNPVSLPEQFGRYRILRKLGGGGMGTVYLAEDTELSRKVALKVPHFTTDDTVATSRFKREARIAAGIDHPNLCPVYDVGEVGGTLYLTMPYIEGKQLSRWLKEEIVWQPEAAALLVRKLALALGVMHERGVMHRDLKPSNVLVGPGGEPVLVDFGLARSFDGKTQTLTDTGERLGTPAYMSPEQVLGDSKKIGPATDIYSLGMILFELVTGKLPFTGPPMAMYGQILHAKLPPPSELRPGLDGQIDALCLKALAKNAEDRFSSMGAFAEALAVYAERVPAPAAVPADASRTAPATATEANEPELIEDVRIVCSKCKRQLHVPPEYRGKRMKCPRCGMSLGTAPVPAPPPAVPAAPPLDPLSRVPRPAEPETAANSSVNTATTPPWRSRVLRKPAPLLAAGAGALLLVVGLILLLGGPGPPPQEEGDDGKIPKQEKELTLELRTEQPLYQLTAGQPAKVRVRVKRGQVVGPIALKLDSPPRGIRGPTGVIDIGKDDGELEIETEQGAGPFGGPVTIVATAAAAQGKTTVHLSVDPVVLPPTQENALGMNFVLVRRDKFRMGSPTTEPERGNDETPHEVQILCSYYLGVHEVTQDQYQQVMGKNPSRFTQPNGGGPNHPVENVSYADAVEFCRKLSEQPQERQARRSYRLPTEAEWEFACRLGGPPGGMTLATHYGNSLSAGEANFDGDFPYNGGDKIPRVGATTPIGKYRASNLGLFDMHGNVWEWCNDWYQDDYYTKGPMIDPQGPDPTKTDPPPTSRVVRGGAWDAPGDRCRSAYRTARDPNRGFDNVGFRVVLILGFKGP